jgi:hypothetical protein
MWLAMLESWGIIVEEMRNGFAGRRFFCPDITVAGALSGYEEDKDSPGASGRMPHRLLRPPRTAPLMDIYKTPKAPVKDSKPDHKPGSALKALLVGSMIDIPGSFVVSFIVSLLAMIVLMSQGLNQQQASSMLQLDHEGSTFSWILNGVGFLMSVNAGYWCARVANRPSLGIPAIQALISTSVSFLLTPKSEMTQLALILNLSTFPAVMAGAALFQLQRRSASA